MDLGTKSRVGGGAIAAALSIIASMLGGHGQGAASAGAGLTPFASCDALRQWYVDRTIDRVGPYGWGGTLYAARESTSGVAEDSASSASSAGDPVTGSATGTNTQEAGIDEPDVAKTDGRIVVRLRDGKLVITDVTGATARELATWRLPRDTHADQLLLVRDHVLLTAQDSGPIVMEDRAFPGEMAEIARTTSGTDLFDIDVSDPSDPELVAHTRWSGQLLSMRQYDDRVRLVTSTGLPDLPFVQPGRGTSESEATLHNRQVVRDSTIEQWLPSVRGDDGTSRRAVDCSRVFHPPTDSARGPGRPDPTTVGVFTLHPGDTAPASSVAVTGSGADVYSSADRLYVWGTDWGSPMQVGSRSRSLIRPMTAPHTSVHAFAIEDDDTSYVASGRVDGQVRDRWSLDERDGYLRVAVAWPRQLPAGMPEDPDSSVSSSVGSSDNGFVVLAEQGDRLVPVGSLRGLGRNEDIQSVRWLGELAVVVTFRQIDPLYTVDLSDPAHPRLLGELEMPGFSSYLHPIGDDRLLGLGTAATMQGESLGAKAAVFDLGDPTRVRELDQLRLAQETRFGAADDPHAFTWLPSGAGTGTAIAQVDDGFGSQLIALRVTRDGAIATTEVPEVGGWQLRALPLPDGRVALVGDRVEIVSVG